ncbi:ATP-dependent metalloprotease [Heterostelium album PN500]|uniref:ATP-dependent metalloprotease n=1 Tax=Heterostelium pallidum (strain ATCC 26659 / Pp 5 / PN500) TaxID=670386 RepID=D3BAN7_HETP5|nr:ATP-dependent metalloprotease [Heterostelium album PN500]EFA81624.1 ATP-dependent metalloprotease [Heterostelium album PN500]|eukprot:XP_020433741.1 ATP-dependent metalloprotease [Heterostelium album PN500]
MQTFDEDVDAEKMLKIIVIGNTNVGKTSIINNLCYDQTLASINTCYFNDANAALVVMDSTKLDCTVSAKNWKKELDKNFPNEPIPTFLLANKFDLISDDPDLEMLTSKFQKFSNENNFDDWAFTSARDGSGILETVENLVTLTIKQTMYRTTKDRDSFRLSDPPPTNITLPKEKKRYNYDLRNDIRVKMFVLSKLISNTTRNKLLSNININNNSCLPVLLKNNQFNSLSTSNTTHSLKHRLNIINNDNCKIKNYYNSQNNYNNKSILFSRSIVSKFENNNNNNNANNNLGQQRHSYSTARSKALNKADENPKDENAQELLYHELMDMGDYETIISRFESMAYASNEECIRYYFMSLVYSKKLNKANISLLKDLEGYSLKFGTTDDVKEKINQQPIIPLVKISDLGTVKMSTFDRISSMIWLPLLCLLVYYIMKDSDESSSKQSSVAKEYSEASNSATFEDVKGIDEVKHELEEIVDYLKNPEKYDRIGAKLPKGILMSGEPGTGKTLLARAIAGEAEIPFFYTAGSSFDEKYVGVGAKRVRELFDLAKSKQPCIIFIDEIDAVGKSRHSTHFNETLLQLLSEMDGFSQNNKVMVIGATNSPESLDPALTRPGRFDRLIAVPIPDFKGRKEIVDFYLSKVVHDRNEISSERIARATPGFTGADISNLINTAAIKAVLHGKDQVSLKLIDEARDDILMGRARKSAIISEEVRKNTAYHEAGHALVAALSDCADPIHKATIVQRGHALGMVSQLPENDHMQFTRKQMMTRLAICLAGRAAEEIFFGHDNVTSGASSDFQQASKLAFSMITKWGMSDKLGFTYHQDKMSPEIMNIVDNEVKLLLDIAPD